MERWRWLLLGLVMLTACADKTDAPGASFDSVKEIVNALEAEGIACENLTMRDRAKLDEAQAAAKLHTPPPGAVPPPAFYEVKESGLCQFEGSPELLGEVLASTITVYETDEHLESIPEEGFPEMDLVYGSNWLIQLPKTNLAERVKDALDGRVVPGVEREVDEELLALSEAHCFYTALRPGGLDAAAESLGLSDADPQRLAEALAGSNYNLPENVKQEASRLCLKGFEMASAVTDDDRALSRPPFLDFWRKVCSAFPYSGITLNDMGLDPEVDSEVLDNNRIASAITQHFLGRTGMSQGELKRAAARCKTGLMGD